MEDLGKKEFIRYFHRALRDQDMNPELARSEFAQANAMLITTGYPEEKYPEAIAEAAQNNETLIERLNWDFYLKDIPYSQKENYMRAYNSTTQLYQGRGRYWLLLILQYLRLQILFIYIYLDLLRNLLLINPEALS